MKEKTKIDNQEEKIDPLTTDKAEVYLEGLRIACEMGSISCVMLQRKLSIGYAFAFRILEWMVEQGFIDKGLKKDYIKRTLITPEEYERFRDSIDIPVKEPVKEECEEVRTIEIDEELYKRALRLSVEEESASFSMFQRKLCIGFNKAGAILERMEADGFVEPFSGAKARKVLLTKEKFKERYGEDL